MNSTRLFTVLSALTIIWVLPADHAQAQGNQGSGISSLFQGGGIGGLLGGLGSNSAPQGGGGLLGGLQGLLPSANRPASPGADIIARVNQRSKEAIDKTTGWARQKKQEMTSKVLGNTLGGLFSSFKSPGQNPGGPAASSPFDFLKPNRGQPTAQPPLRSTQNFERQPSLRF